MMTHNGERVIEKVEKAYGGAGHIEKELLLNEKELGEHCGLFGRVTIPVGSELGHHDHIGESETYFILQGEGQYEEDGVIYEAKVGDVFYCADGSGHGLKNTGDVDVVFAALILKK
jgi:quercetin dioxygenase-like cupin family protein